MQITTIGLDIAKNVFQVHGIDATEKVVVRKQLRRSQVMAFFEALASVRRLDSSAAIDPGCVKTSCSSNDSGCMIPA
jgi:transposase